MKLLDRVFRREEINGHGVCPTYLYRWTLLRIGWLAIYLHHFVGDDWSRDMHDHPKRFVSVGLWGRYFEETPEGIRPFRAPWLRSFAATHIHRIRLQAGETCWTLCLVIQPTRPWGFWRGQTWVPWKRYVTSDVARNNKSCG